MFESGGWARDSEDEDEDDDGVADPWNLEAMRKETERLRQAKEEERLARMNGGESASSFAAGDSDGGGGVEDEEGELEETLTVNGEA